MVYSIPGLFSGGEDVAPARARTTVLARAFSDAVGGYFERWKMYEDAIRDAEDEMERMKRLGAGGVGAGVVLVLVGGLVVGDVDGFAIAAVGLLLAIGAAAYARMQYSDAEDRIGKNEHNIAINEPDGTVTFVSQVAVPMYLVPYADRHMVFDGLDTAPQATVNLANIDVERLAEQRGTLENRKAAYDEHLAGATVIGPDAIDELPDEFAAELSPEGEDSSRIEAPLARTMRQMTRTAGDIERDTIDVNVHANNAKSASLRQLAASGALRRNGSHREIEVPRSIGECEAAVSEIRGFEELALSGDMLDQAREHRDTVDEIGTELAQRLRDSAATVGDHYAAYAEDLQTSMHKHVCPECLASRSEDLEDELDIVGEVLDAERGGLGAALSDEDLDRMADDEGDRPFTESIRADIREEIPELPDRMRAAHNTLDDLGPDGGYCEVHGSVESTAVADSGTVFGEVWRSLYYNFREPIIESADDLEREAEEVRQNKEQKMIDLAQYEQIKENVAREYYSVESEYEAAQRVEQRLGD